MVYTQNLPTGGESSSLGPESASLSAARPPARSRDRSAVVQALFLSVGLARRPYVLHDCSVQPAAQARLVPADALVARLELVLELDDRHVNEVRLINERRPTEEMRVGGLPVLSPASLSETELGAGGADTADPSSTATAAEPMRVGSAASAAGAPAQTTPSDCKLGANLSVNALGEDVNEETTRGLQLDPATTARTANVGPAAPRGADISVLRHIDAKNSHFSMLNEAGAAAAQTPNEVVPTSSSPTPPSPTPSEASTARSADHRAAWECEASATELDASEEEEEEELPSRREKPVRSQAAKQRRHRLQAVRRRLRVEGLSIGASGGGGDEEGSGGGGVAASSSDGASGNADLNSEVLALRRALADREAVLKLTRKQLRRQTKTSKARHAQLARKDSKAAKKAVKQQRAKVARDVAGAARRERRRKWKGAVAPEGESVHSSDAKRRRLLEKGVEIASGAPSSSQPTMRMAAAGREAAEALAAPTRGSGRSRGSEGGGGGRNAGQCWDFASTGQCRYGGHCKFGTALATAAAAAAATEAAEAAE